MQKPETLVALQFEGSDEIGVDPVQRHRPEGLALLAGKFAHLGVTFHTAAVSAPTGPACTEPGQSVTLAWNPMDRVFLIYVMHSQAPWLCVVELWITESDAAVM
jgi:hypothetical protein